MLRKPISPENEGEIEQEYRTKRKAEEKAETGQDDQENRTTRGGGGRTGE